MKKTKRSLRWLWSGPVIYILFSVFQNGEVVRNVFCKTLRVCFSTILPVLFPYMILARMIVSLDLFTPLFRFFLRKQTRNHAETVDAIVVYFTGNLCGYPVGAAESASLVRCGKTDEYTAGILCALSSCGNPIYFVQIVGTFYWHSAVFGWLLLGIQWITSCSAALILLRRKQRQTSSPLDACKKIAFSPEYKTYCPSVGAVLATAIGDSSAACVSVCGCIVFFSILSALLPPFPPLFSAFLSGFLEFTSGVQTGAALGGRVGAMVTGFSMGFGGLSVMMQIADRLRGTSISMRYTICWKLFQGCCTGIAAFFLWGILPKSVLTVAPLYTVHSYRAFFLFGWWIFTQGCICRAVSWYKKKEYRFSSR